MIIHTVLCYTWARAVSPIFHHNYHSTFNAVHSVPYRLIRFPAKPNMHGTLHTNVVHQIAVQNHKNERWERTCAHLSSPSRYPTGVSSSRLRVTAIDPLFWSPYGGAPSNRHSRLPAPTLLARNSLTATVTAESFSRLQPSTFTSVWIPNKSDDNDDVQVF